jgi:hypothetical protein
MSPGWPSKLQRTCDTRLGFDLLKVAMPKKRKTNQVGRWEVQVGLVVVVGGRCEVGSSNQADGPVWFTIQHW